MLLLVLLGVELVIWLGMIMSCGDGGDGANATKEVTEMQPCTNYCNI
jgi:hypothetical protein